MTFERFKEIIDAYGSNENKWPEEERLAAIEFAAMNSEAVRPLIDQAHELDTALNLVENDENYASDLLRQRILNDASHTFAEIETTSPRQPALRRYANAAMLAVAFCAGFAGANFTKPDQTTNTTVAVVDTDENWSLIADTLGMDDIYQWAEGSSDISEDETSDL